MSANGYRTVCVCQSNNMLLFCGISHTLSHSFLPSIFIWQMWTKRDGEREKDRVRECMWIIWDTWSNVHVCDILKINPYCDALLPVPVIVTLNSTSNLMQLYTIFWWQHKQHFSNTCTHRRENQCAAPFIYVNHNNQKRTNTLTDAHTHSMISSARVRLLWHFWKSRSSSAWNENKHTVTHTNTQSCCWCLC